MTNYYSDEFRKLIQKYDLAHTRWDSDISEKALSILLEDYYIEPNCMTLLWAEPLSEQA